MTALWVVLAVLVLGGLYFAHVRLFPWKTCTRCDGKGRRYSDGAWRSGGAHQDCGRCGATGRVRRWGAGKEN